MTTPTEFSQPAYLCPQQSDLWPEPETADHLFKLHVAARAVRILKRLGWTTGCDGELLPPDWARREEL